MPSANVRAPTPHVTDNATSTQTKTTASFTPTANSLLVVVVSAVKDGHTTAFNHGLTDSLGGTWTLEATSALQTTKPTFATQMLVWSQAIGSSPSAMTITYDPFVGGTAVAYNAVRVMEFTDYLTADWTVQSITFAFTFNVLNVTGTLGSTPTGLQVACFGASSDASATFGATPDGWAELGGSRVSASAGAIGTLISGTDPDGSVNWSYTGGTDVTSMVAIMEVAPSAAAHIARVPGSGLNVGFPLDLDDGDLLILVLVNDGGDDQTTAGGLTRFDTNNGTSMEAGAYWRVISGSPPTGSFTFGVTAEDAVWHWYVIPASLRNTGTNPEAAKVGATATGTIDPPSLAPSGWDASAEQTIWIVAGARDDDDGISSLTADYAPRFEYTRSSLTADAVELASSWRIAAVEPENPGAATHTGTAEEFVAYTIAVRPSASGTNAPAGLATVTTAALAPSTTIRPTAGVATAATAALGPVPTVRPTAELATVGLAALGPTTIVRANAGLATVGVAAPAVSAAIRPAAEVATTVVAALDPTASTATQTLAPAGLATVATSASDVGALVHANAVTATVSAAGLAPVATVRPTAQTATIGVSTPSASTSIRPTAQIATVSATATTPAATVRAAAGVATVAGAALDAVGQVRAAAQPATVTGTALAPNAVVRATPGTAAVTVAGLAATVSTSSQTNAQAGLATVDTTASEATASVRPVAQTAPVSVAAQDATVSTSASTSAPAGLATVTVTAPNTASMIRAITEPVSVTAVAQTPVAIVRATAAPATVTVVGQPASVATITSTPAPAGLATVTGQAHNPTTSVRPNAATPGVAVQGLNPVAVISQAGIAHAGLATVRATAWAVYWRLRSGRGEGLPMLATPQTITIISPAEGGPDAYGNDTYDYGAGATRRTIIAWLQQDQRGESYPAGRNPREQRWLLMTNDEEITAHDRIEWPAHPLGPVIFAVEGPPEPAYRGGTAGGPVHHLEATLRILEG